MKKQFLSTLLLMFTLSIVSCQKDNTTVAEGSDWLNGIEGTNTVYAHIKITNSDITRTANTNDNTFENGSTEENTVHNLLIVFYGEYGEVIGYYDDKEWIDREDTDTTDDIESNIEWKEAEVVPVKMLHSGEPLYAIAFLNYDEQWSSELTDKNISEVTSIVKNTYSISVGEQEPVNYFLMTNSGYFDSEDNYQIATNIKGFVFPTAEEAKNSPAITIYVERAAARIDFKLGESAYQKYEIYYGSEAYELDFTPDKWGITATEQENYILKNMQESLSDYAGTDYASDFSEWISYGRHRTYWAETPKYNTYTYPEAGFSAYNQDLVYIKDAEVNTAFAEDDGYAKLYTFEHTFNAADLYSSVNAYAVPTSLILKGTYKAVKKSDNSELNFNEGGFYVRSVANTKHIYLEKNTENKDDLLIAFLNEQTILYTKDNSTTDPGEETFTPVTAEDAYEDFEIINTQVFYYADGRQTKSSNAYTLQIKSDVTNRYYLRSYVAATGTPDTDDYTAAHYEYMLIDAASMSAANIAIQQNVGSAFKYDLCKTYFYIPILHYLDKNSYPENEYTGDFATKTDEEVNYIINKTGEFGIVRNHIYRLTLDKIEGLGAGNPGTDNPLIPDSEENKQWFFHAKLEILSWHLIDFNFNLKK